MHLSEASCISTHEPTSTRFGLPKLLLVTGRPGAGKDTHGDQIAGHFGYDMLRTSKLLADFVAQDPTHPDAVLVRHAMEKGGMAPDDVTARVVTPTLIARLRAGHIIPNGFPRTPGQYDVFRQILAAHGIDDDVCLHFDISAEHATDRILKGGRGRPDDNLATIQERMRVYDRDTEPVVAAYEKLGRLLRVKIDNPAESIESVQERARKLLLTVIA